VKIHPKHSTPGVCDHGELDVTEHEGSPISDISLGASLRTENDTTCETPKDILNKFLLAKYVSPINHSLATSWDEASERTKRGYIRTAKQVVDACLEEIVPNDTEILFQSLYKESKSDSTVDSKYRESQADWYGKRSIP
jgi:ribosomal protein RSM22 (predicted rRNA methylase)